MVIFHRLASVGRGLLWLLRGGGLRESLRRLDQQIQRVDSQVRRAVERMAPAPPTGEALTPALVSVAAHLDTLPARLNALEGQLREMEARLTQVAARTLDEEVRRQQAERWRQAGDLRGFERKVFSQNGEDGILREIFHRIGTTNRFFIEFGVESGHECNCRFLAEYEGWGGLFLEPDRASFARLREVYAGRPAVRCVNAAVTSRNADALFREHGAPDEPDLLSIDIDGNDYWVWAAVREFRPRVVAIEYNPFHLPPKRWVMTEDLDYRWNRTTYFGASLASLAALGAEKGYELVATDSHGVNAFFVRKDGLPPGKFLDPYLHYHFTPFGYHPPPTGQGPFEEV